MAEANAALQKLKDQITCSLCLETYADPKVLPCLHVNCQKCLQKLQQSSIDGTIQCPTCRQDTTTTAATTTTATTTNAAANDVADLPSAFFIHSYIDGYNSMKKALESHQNQNQSETPYCCVNCPESEAVGFCQECKEHMCKSCQKVHSKSGKSKKHSVRKIEKKKASKKTDEESKTSPGAKIFGGNKIFGGGAKKIPSASKDSNTCSLHPDEELKVCCETCDVMICRDCILRDHRSHNYYLAEEAAARHKEDILSSLKPVEKEVETIDAALTSVRTRLAEVKTKGVGVKSEIIKNVEKMQAELENRKASLLFSLDKLVNEKVESLSAQEDQLDSIREQASSCIKSVHCILDRSTDKELMSVKTRVPKQVNEVMTRAKNTAKEPKEKAEISFVSSEQLLAECKQYGIVLSRPADLFYVGETVRASQIHKEVSVPIQTVGSYHPRHFSTSMQHVVLAGSMLTLVPSKLIKNPRTNTFLVVFSSPVRGANNVVIKVNGVAIKNSPACMFMYTPTPTRVIALDKPDMVALTTNLMVVVGDSRRHVTIYSKQGQPVQSFILRGKEPYPRGVAIDDEGSLLVTDRSDSTITKYKPNGDFVTQVGMEGKGPLQFSGSCGIAVEKKTKKIYIADQNNHRVQVLNSDLTLSHMFGTKGRGAGQFDQPRDVAVIGGEVFVADRSNNRIQVFKTNGDFSREFGKKGTGNGGLNFPVGVCIDWLQYVIVSDFGNDRICVFNLRGEFITTFGKRGTKSGEFTSPYGIATDNNGMVYVADYGNNRIQIF